MNRTEAAEVVATLAAGYDKNLGDATLRVWLEQLEPLDAAKARHTVKLVIATSGKFPAIAEFRAIYASHNPPQPFTPSLDADEPRLERDRVRQRIAALKERLNQTTTGPTPAPTSESFSTPTPAAPTPHSGAQAADA